MRADPFFDPATPEDRLREVAAILARGLLRLQCQRRRIEPEKPLETEGTRLEVRPETSVTVHTG